MAEVREIASGLRFPEGPIAMPDGSVVLVEMFGQCITRVWPDGSTETVAEVPGGPNGAAIGPDGALYLCNNGGCFTPVDLGGMWLPGPFDESAYLGGRIQRVDLATGVVTDLYTECDGRPLRAPNDLVFDRSGGFWFTDHGIRTERTSDRTGIHYATADGSRIVEAVHPVDTPNGVGLSPDGQRVYWAETHTGRVFQRTITGPGEVVDAGPLDFSVCLAGLPGLSLLDSLAVDAEGNVCVATIGQDAGITVVAPDGSGVVERHPMPDLLTTNICFGGPDLRTAYVTLSSTGKLVATEWPRPGLALAF